MLKIQKINLSHIPHCLDSLSNDLKEFQYFQDLGWSKKQLINQINKKHNYSLGLWQSNILIAYLIGELIYVEKKSEYEILLLYVDKNFRNQGHATFLINALISSLKSKKLSKITLEVPKSNYIAINLYRKNYFFQIGKRKDYYKNKITIKKNALIFEKKINE